MISNAIDVISCFSDDYPGATLTTVSQLVGRGTHLNIMLDYKIEVDGHLVAWQYYIANDVEACPSYAVIWRDTGETYTRIAETELKPQEQAAGGVKFQFVQDSNVIVRKGDVLGYYVGSEAECNGHLISIERGPYFTTPVSQYYDGDERTSRPSSIRKDETVTDRIVAAMKAYVAGEHVTHCCNNYILRL